MRFVAFERTQQGTGASRRLRNAQKVPGIVYGAGTPSMIELDHNALFFALKKEAFHSSLLEMELAGKTEQVLLRDYQMHPFRPIVMHIDFQRVDATTKVTKKVPLHFVNEENSPAVKTDGCVVNHIVNEINIQCVVDFQLTPLAGGAPFQGQKKMMINQTAMPRVGDVWPCWYNPANPAEFAVGMPDGLSQEQVAVFREFGIPHPLDPQSQG